MTKRITAFVYGVASYMIFLAVFVYSIGFIGNFAVPKSLDSTPESPLSTALLVNLLLLSVFAIQHSVMARQWFKRALTTLIPESVERSTYVLLSSLALILLVWKWQPMGGSIWNVENTIGIVLIEAAFALGWIILLLSTFLINHFDLFGMRQVWLYLAGRPYEPLEFRTPFLYRYVRHPLYVGWLFIFWSTPTMTTAHLLFALATTAYILIAIQFEERDLRKLHPEYERYAKQVPMMVPALSRNEK